MIREMAEMKKLSTIKKNFEKFKTLKTTET